MASAFAQPEATIVRALPATADRTLVERCRQARKDERLAVLEGLHALKHALRFGATIEAAYTDDLEALTRLAEAVAPDIAGSVRNMTRAVPAKLFAALAPRPPETGVLALARRPSLDIDALDPARLAAPAVFLDGPAHLGNVGAVVRVAAATGAAAVITSGRHDPWDPAALRGAAGLHFALPVVRADASPEGWGPLIAIDPEGEPLSPDAIPAGALLAFGSERRGLDPTILDGAERRLALPMRDHVSSLNLATTVSAVLYAWRLSQPQG